MKGIVVKTDGREAIVLTRDRRFIRIPAPPDTAVGQETEVPRECVSRGGSRTRRIRLWGAVAVACLLAVSVWRLMDDHSGVPSAYAYVTVDVDEAVEFVVDADHRVRALQLVGTGGRETRVSDYRGKPIFEAVGKWVHDAVANRRLRDGGEVFISTTGGSCVSPGDIEQLNRKVAYAVADAVKRDLDLVHVDALQVPEEVRRKALAEGVSPGRYYLYVMAKNRGLAVNLEEFRRQSIAVLLSNHRELTGLLQQIQEGGEKQTFF